MARRGSADETRLPAVSYVKAVVRSVRAFVEPLGVMSSPGLVTVPDT
jgi:hypothetical protein